MSQETARSEYLGVYPNTNAKHMAEVPFRVAIRSNLHEKDTLTNYGYLKSDRVAAKFYNLYAINRFGEKAIINAVKLTAAEVVEFNEFINAKPKRIARLAEAKNRAVAITGGGLVFRTHLDLAKQQAEQEAAQAEALAAVAADMLAAQADRNGDLDDTFYDDIPF